MLSGDCGFDPLSLGTNPDTLKWFAEAELTNGRWAMAAVAGILFTELVGLPKFWLAGAEVSQLVPGYRYMRHLPWLDKILLSALVSACLNPI